MATIETLTDDTPRYFSELEKDAAFDFHYTNGGYLWRRKEGQSTALKKYASGVLPASRMEIYDLFMVDGRCPTDADRDEALKTVEAYEKDVAWYHEPTHHFPD